MAFFLPRHWRLPKVVLALIILELAFTVANLALFGIAAPNTYRTKLWAYGGEHGFNSDPKTVAYAAYNYKEMKIPLVWSSLNTNYNMYVGVVCMFFWLIKITLWFLHIFYPILSLMLHIPLAGLWAASLYLQTAPDTVDPAHENHGAPWYITKSCNIVEDNTLRGYCQQAKSAFAVSVCMLAIYVGFIIMTVWSLYPTKEARIAHQTKVAEKKAEKEKWESSPYDNEPTAEEQWQHMWELQQLPRTPGTAVGNAPWRTPATPRTRAFNELQGGHEAAGYYGNEVQMPHTAQPPQQHTSVAYAGVPGQGQAQNQDDGIYDGNAKGSAM